MLRKSTFRTFLLQKQRDVFNLIKYIIPKKISWIFDSNNEWDDEGVWNDDANWKD